MAAIVLDLSLFPLVISALPPQFAEGEVETYFNAFRALHERDEPFVHVSDLSRAERMSTTVMRHKATAFMAEEAERSRRLCKGSVQVASSRLMRGAMTALYWVSPPPYPHAVVATAVEGIDWAAACAEEAQLVVDVAAARALAERLFGA